MGNRNFMIPEEMPADTTDYLTMLSNCIGSNYSVELSKG
jgi:hypothetical protein